MSLVLIVLALATIYLLRFLPRMANFVRMVRFANTLKGPGPMELAENVRKGEVLYWLRDLRTKYGSTFRIWFGNALTVYLTDPDDVKHILGSNRMLYKSRNYRVIEPWLGRGLLTSGGELWHTRRKMLTPAFHFRKLGEFKQPMEDNCKILIEKLSEKAINEEAFDIYPFITLLALDLICETAMGIKTNAQLESTSNYVTAVQNMCRICHQQSFSIWKRHEFLFSFTKDFIERQRALDILHGETNRVIQMRKKDFKASNINTLADAENADDVGVKKRLAFLDILLLAQMEGAELTDVDIREEVDTFMFEGHDTTSSALSFAIYLLSQNKAEQQKAYEEAFAMKGKEKETMKYLEAVIKETLRLYPSVPIYSRMMMEDVKTQNLTIPKGTSIALLAYVVHRDEKHFPEPDRFNPERFLIDEKNMHPYAFIAFSAGPRNCIGQKFAMLELKCTLSNLLRTFELLPVEGFVPLPLAELVTKSGNGIQVRLRKR